MPLQSITTEQIAKKIQQSTYCVVLSGAGVSTAAGIPDFRGPHGIYITKQYDPEKTFDIGYFRSDPTHFYKFTWDFLSFRHTIRPSITHRTLAELEKRGKVKSVITQNIDGLHQQAGSEHVLEIHGSYGTAGCRNCEFQAHDLTSDWWLERMEQNEQHIAHCPECGGLLKPGIVFFGENVHGMWEAETHAKNADLMLVLGSSLTVYPAALLPQITTGDIVIVNQGSVQWSGNEQTFLLNADLETVFRNLAHQLDMKVTDNDESNHSHQHFGP